MALVPQAASAILLLVLTLCLQCAGVAALIEWLRRMTADNAREFGPIRSAVLVVKSTIAIVLLHGLVILLWASFYRLQCFPSWELAFYFSSSSYATVGYGDVTLPANWRLLGPLESMAGVLMCGVSVCILFATITRLLDRDPRHSRKQNQAGDPVSVTTVSTHLPQAESCDSREGRPAQSKNPDGLLGFAKASEHAF